MNSFFKYVNESFKVFTNTRTLVFAAMFISLNIILTRYFSIQTQFIRIGFGFLPVAIYAMLFGPVAGAFAAAVGDVIGFFLFPQGLYFPGFTFSAFMSGMIYGLYFYKKKITVLRIVLATITVILLIDLGMNTLWLSILYNKGVALIVFGR